MAEPSSPVRGAASPEQEPFGARPAPDAKVSRGSQPAAKKMKGADERSLKGAKRVNGEGGGGGGNGGSGKLPLPAVVPSYSNPAAWGFPALPSGPSGGAGGFAFPSQLPRKLLSPAVLLPSSASPSSSYQQHQHRHHRHRLALAGEAGGCGSGGAAGGSAKPKRPKEKRDKERRKHGALPVVAAVGDGGGALSAAGREENGEVKLLLPKGEGRALRLCAARGGSLAARSLREAEGRGRRGGEGWRGQQARPGQGGLGAVGAGGRSVCSCRWGAGNGCDARAGPLEWLPAPAPPQHAGPRAAPLGGGGLTCLPPPPCPPRSRCSWACGLRAAPCGGTDRWPCGSLWRRQWRLSPPLILSKKGVWS